MNSAMAYEKMNNPLFLSRKKEELAEKNKGEL
jgi:hypothetical protein